MPSARIRGLNEQISTFGGGSRQYTNAVTWEDTTSGDLVAAQESRVLECYADQATFPTASINLAGSTTSADYRRIIRPALWQGHKGTPNSGVHFTGTTPGGVILSNEQWGSIQDLVVTQAANNNSFTAYGIQIGSAGGSNNNSIIGCLVKSTNAGTAGAYGIAFGGNTVVADCLAYGCTNSGIWQRTSNTSSLYNCTSVANTVGGFVTTGGTFTLKNCLGAGNLIADFSGTFAAASTHNAASDLTAPGHFARFQQDFGFVNPAGLDWHLAHWDRCARGRGIDLSLDLSFAFDDDVDGERFQPWAIGFDNGGGPSGVLNRPQDSALYSIRQAILGAGARAANAVPVRTLYSRRSAILNAAAQIANAPPTHARYANRWVILAAAAPLGGTPAARLRRSIWRT